ncbi:hypothetical protein CFBP6600_32610 [Xanthomonas arboricola pv. corylina]|uniref:helix-turn-helix domain-containing protein n=1 Tax=Xanthomonas arboricola TaxID=56448 RepID=UPI001CE6B550|nr:hypothetical protein CFBP6600_32610 [Xanthomonas arboricola pv. corylina]CAE6817930.1 hypothetical protein CFBP6600_32610 [Xanthomonas arboricola pv. corylina]
MNPRNRGLGGHSPQHVQALLNQGLTQRALAERVGVTHQAVSRFVRRHGLLSGGCRPTDHGKLTKWLNAVGRCDSC